VRRARVALAQLVFLYYLAQAKKRGIEVAPKLQ